MDRPAISIIVVAYRHREALALALDSCLEAAARTPGGAELLVIDNGGLAPFVRERWPSLEILEPGENLGFAGAVQLGLGAARGDWIALVNDDARIEPDSLARLLQAGAANAHIGSVAAQVRFEADPSRVNSAGISVDALGAATERLAGLPVAAASQPAEVFGACGCFALYRREMLEQLGGFDARFFAYLEDVDVAWRARAAGWSAVYEPRAVALHQGSASTGEGSRGKYFLVGRNRVRLLARNATASQLLLALPGILLYDSAYVLYALVADRTLAPLKGRLRGLREWRTFRGETSSARRPVALEPATRAFVAGLRMRRAYRRLGA
jgi:GT2 family glycosyltransferase